MPGRSMLSELMLKIGRALDRARIPYMIIGGQAVMLYGEPRLTKDIDITLGVGADPDSIKTICALLKKSGIKPLPPDPIGFAKKTMTLPALDPKSGVRLDLIFADSAFEKQALKRRKQRKIKNKNIYFVSAEDLIILKIIAGRPRDLDDARRILLKQKKLDYSDIESWLKKFGRALDADYLKLFKSIR